MSTQPVFKYVPATFASWDQNPEYIEACRTASRLGDPTCYPSGHPRGASVTDVTDFKVGLAGWNENNLPDIMYQLWPCEAWRAFRSGPKPGPRLDAQGHEVLERYPQPGQKARVIRDFPILRDKYRSTMVVFEIISRLDPRIKWEDIDMLMERVGLKLRQPNRRKFTNCLNNICSRGRQDWLMVSWRERSKGAKANGARDRVLAALDQTQHALNTTRGSTPGLDRFGIRVPLPARRKRRNTSSTQLKASKRRKVEEDEELEELDNNDEDGESDIDMSILTQSASRPKRKRSGPINYAVGDESEDSADSEFELEKASKRRTKRRKTRDDTEVSECPRSRRLEKEQLEDDTDIKRENRPKKKQRTSKTDGAREMSSSELRPQPPPSSKGNVSRGGIIEPRLRRVEEARKHRAHRLPPRSTSSALHHPPPSLYATQATHGTATLPSSPYEGNHNTNQSAIPGTSNFRTSHYGMLDPSMPYDPSGRGVYHIRPSRAQTRDMNSFERGMLMHSSTGFMPSDEGYVCHAEDDVDRSSEKQAHWGIFQSNPTASQHGYRGIERGYQTSHSAVIQEADNHVGTSFPNSNQKQNVDFFNEDFMVGDEPLRTYGQETSRWSSAQTSSYSSLSTDSQFQLTSGWRPRPPSDVEVSMNRGLTGVNVPASTATYHTMQNVAPGRARAAAAARGDHATEAAMQEAMGLPAYDPFEGISDPVAWNSGWDSFNNPSPNFF